MVAGPDAGPDAAAAAITRDGSLAIAYFPEQRTITLDLAQLASRHAGAVWFDPRTGARLPADDFPTDSTRDFTPPSVEDWLLLLEARER